MSTTNDCCGETQKYNPKSERGRKRNSGLTMMDLPNPIPGEIQDDDSLSKLLEKWQLVPYAGKDKSTGDSLLVWLLMLAQLSPTHGACIRKKIKYAVGGRVTFTRAKDPDFDIGEESNPMSAAEKSAYMEAIKKFIAWEGGIRNVHKRAAWQFETNGNSFIELSFSKVLDQPRVSLKSYKTTNVKYKLTKPDEMRVVAISPVWTAEYLKKNPPRFVPIFPNFVVDENGVKRTMFHLNGSDTTWYGRPESESASLYMYRELQDSIYLVKQSAGNFVGQLIIEVEDDDPETAPAIEDDDAKENGFTNFPERLERNFTNKGDDPQSVLVTARPYGSRPMFVHQIAPNTNENWYKVTGEISEQKILRAHGCTLRFMGFDAANGFSTDAFVSDYVMNMEPVINGLRETITSFTNKIMSVCWALVGMEQMNDFSISFSAPIQNEIERFQQAQNQSNQPADQIPSGPVIVSPGKTKGG